MPPLRGQRVRPSLRFNHREWDNPFLTIIRTVGRNAGEGFPPSPTVDAAPTLSGSPHGPTLSRHAIAKGGGQVAGGSAWSLGPGPPRGRPSLGTAASRGRSWPCSPSSPGRPTASP